MSALTWQTRALRALNGALGGHDEDVSDQDAVIEEIMWLDEEQREQAADALLAVLDVIEGMRGAS